MQLVYKIKPDTSGLVPRIHSVNATSHGSLLFLVRENTCTGATTTVALASSMVGDALTGALEPPECLAVEVKCSARLAAKTGPSWHQDLQLRPLDARASEGHSYGCSFGPSGEHRSLVTPISSIQIEWTIY